MYPASNCIDGDLTTVQDTGSCKVQGSWNSVDPWLQIDLGTTHNVGQVTLYNIQDSYRPEVVARLAHHQIWLSDSLTTPATKCFDGTAGNGDVGSTENIGPFEEECIGTGRYVRIVLPGGSRILNLAEVKVFGGTVAPTAAPSTAPTAAPTVVLCPATLPNDCNTDNSQCVMTNSDILITCSSFKATTGLTSFQVTIGSTEFNGNGNSQASEQQYDYAAISPLSCGSEGNPNNEINSGNWNGGDTYTDTFLATLNDDGYVVATRTDADSSWGMNLGFQCWKGCHNPDTNPTPTFDPSNDKTCDQTIGSISGSCICSDGSTAMAKDCGAATYTNCDAACAANNAYTCDCLEGFDCGVSLAVSFTITGLTTDQTTLAASTVGSLSPAAFLSELSFRMNVESASIPSGMFVEIITANSGTAPDSGTTSDRACNIKVGVHFFPSMGCSEGQFCNLDNGDTGECESCSSFSSAGECTEAGLPTNGACDCRLRCFNVATAHGVCDIDSAGGAGAIVGAGIGCGMLFLLYALYYNYNNKKKTKKVYEEQANTQLDRSDSLTAMSMSAQVVNTQVDDYSDSEDESSPARQPTSEGRLSTIPAPVQMVPIPANPVFTPLAQVIPTNAMPVPFATPLPITASVVILPVGAAAAPPMPVQIFAAPAQVVPAQVVPAQVYQLAPLQVEQQANPTASGEGGVLGRE
jgi:hypothetical protein